LVQNGRNQFYSCRSDSAAPSLEEEFLMRSPLIFLREFKWNLAAAALLAAALLLLVFALTYRPVLAMGQNDDVANRPVELDGVEQSGSTGGSAQNVTGAETSVERAPRVQTTVSDPYVYKVRAGDSWIAIARKFGTTYGDLRETNPELWSRRGVVIRPGDEMAIPGMSAVQMGPTIQYIVAPGDSWYRIAGTFGVSFWDLRLDNPALWARRGVYIRPGDQMTIRDVQVVTATGEDADPGKVSTVAPATRGTTTLPSTEVGMPVPVHQLPEGATLYIVRPGDTWFSIAAKFGVEFEKLRAANPNLWRVRGQALRVNDQMVIPPHGTPPPPIDIKVAPGEPVEEDDEEAVPPAPGEDEATEPDEPVEAESGTPPVEPPVEIGEQTQPETEPGTDVTPVGSERPASEGATRMRINIPDAVLTYTVQAGETWASIATRTGRTLVALQAANPALQGRELQAGDVLRIP
jgi:LysM repeat protein